MAILRYNPLKVQMFLLDNLREYLSGVPRIANSGALDTRTPLSAASRVLPFLYSPKKIGFKRHQLSALTDWFAFCIPAFVKTSEATYDETGALDSTGFRAAQLRDAFDLLGLEREAFSLIESKRLVWDKRYTFDNKINVYFNDEHLMDEHGILVEFTGQGCRIYEEMKPKPWLTLFALAMDLGCTFSRFDMAIDDKPVDGGTVFFTPDQVAEKLEKQERASRWSAWKVVRSGNRKGKLAGTTCYIGSRQSRSMMRCYDKAAEFNRKTKDADKHYKGDWVRTELELRDHLYIVKMLSDLLAGENFGDLIARFLRTWISFRDPAYNSNGEVYENVARDWKESHWWTLFLSTIERISFGSAKPDRTLDEVLDTLRNQWAPLLSVLAEYFEGDMTWLYRVLRDGQERRKKKHHIMLELAIKRRDALEQAVPVDGSAWDHLEE